MPTPERMVQRSATVLNPAKIALLRKALSVAPMTLDLTGLSMFPSIRAGDRCRVAAVDPEAIRIGDILLTTRDDRLFAHRVVSVEAGPPRRWIIKGDMLSVPDPPVQWEDILGRIVGIERRGHVIDLQSPLRRQMGAMMAALSEPYSDLFVRALILRRRILARLAYLPAWRLHRRAHAGEIVVRPAAQTDLDGIAMLFGEQAALTTPMSGLNMEEFRRQARQMLDATRQAGSTVWIAVLDGYIAGHAIIGPLGEDGPKAPGWWVMSVYVKMTARGCGLAERMVQAGVADAASRGEAEIRYAAFETNSASLRLAAKMGFRPEDSPVAQAFISHYPGAGTHGPRLIVMCKELQRGREAD